MFNPVSTYRIQFNKDFTFKNLNEILPFLQQLGVRTVYASPIFAAVPGSLHGYDVINPYEVNPEIGTEAELYAISQKLSAAGIRWIQDIVPNHMAFHHGNIWLMDVLEKGSLSLYRSFFDMSCNDNLFHGRLMVPFLGSALDEVIQKKELAIVYDQGRLALNCYDNFYPINSKSYEVVLTYRRSQEPIPPAVGQWLTQRENLHKIDEPISYALGWHELMLQFSVLWKSDESAEYLKRCLASLNVDTVELSRVADLQSYRLCSWQETDHHINFRRFFTINGLICLNMQSSDVFDHYHKKIKTFIDNNIFQGLRVDHIDGLFDPASYLEQLRILTGNDVYIVVEKILEPGEQLPQSWPIQGTTGYDFLALVNNLFTRNNAEGRFTQIYNTFLRDKRPIQEKISEKKALILAAHMGGELQNLYHFLLELGIIDNDRLKKFGEDDIKSAIAEFLIRCPVYRYYGNKFPLSQDEHAAIEKLLKKCSEQRPALSKIFNLLEEALLHSGNIGDETRNERVAQFYQRCMQFTGPLMAKGVEDTLMYTFNRFIGHNEVGDSPEFFGLTVSDFHGHMNARQAQWPLTLNATATHDTKRGEGVRMRLNVLPTLADQWINLVQKWRTANQSLLKNGAPDANDEYFIYQTLVGTLPLAMEDLNEYKQRLDEYFTKALRESKRHSAWAEPNEDYEYATKKFVSAILQPQHPFWKTFYDFQKKISDFGMINSLAQVLLKFTCPGIPDLYQGTTSWDFSMVDPDNRRQVDYQLQQNNLEKIIANKKKPSELVSELWESRDDARIKLWLVWRLLKQRNEDTLVFTEGFYVPLAVHGKYKNNVVAFARRFRETWYIIAIPLYLAQLCEEQSKEITDVDWGDTHLEIPPEAPLQWEHVLIHQSAMHDSRIFIKTIFQTLPLAILKMKHTEQSRSAGVLMAIPSLPSTFGIGDLGPAARNFADFLSRSGQRYWQLLPLNPTTPGAGYSPYSSHSGMALNPLYISLEILANDLQLLNSGDIASINLPSKNKVDFGGAEKIKHQKLSEAWENFKSKQPFSLYNEFEHFVEKECYWLTDFSHYEVLREHHQNKPWFEWPEVFKLRDSQALAKFTKQNDDELQKIKWFQFILFRQWSELRQYCDALGVTIFGDLPFYVSYDSADVWANPHLFALKADGSIEGMAGVPPDYFDANGQLWGMPVFRWDILKEQRYDWWVKRIHKNLELYGLLRFDHFRAFAAYWEVPAGETTAVNGTWRPGPGADFFRVLKEQFGKLPFVAEDLGDVDDDVFTLRDEFELPGMKVLQFAFGSDMARSMYIPHRYTDNFIVYTGTHDNNTTRGWYTKDLMNDDRRRIDSYLAKKTSGSKVTDEMIRLAYSAVAKIAIIPLQDILNLTDSARMNKPSSSTNNWSWRLSPDQLTRSVEEKLLAWAKVYGRW